MNIFIKRIITIILFWIFVSATLNAQNWIEKDLSGTSAGTICIVSEVNYEQLFLEKSDALKSSWAISPILGVDYFVMDNIYAGASIGLSDGTIKYDFGSYGSSTSCIYDIRIPFRAGVSLLGSNFKLETGPFTSFTVAGNTTYIYGRESSTTKIKEMDVSRVALGWSINLKIFNLLKIGYSFILTNSPYGEAHDIGFLSVGLAYSLPISAEPNRNKGINF